MDLDEFFAELNKPLSLKEKLKRKLWHQPKASVSRVRYNLHYARQRVFKGWDERSEWEMCSVLPKTLGGQLRNLAIQAHGYPIGWTFEAWQTVLMTHGSALIEYAKSSDLDDDHEEKYARAKEALHFVADNIGKLWD